jgi:hypothetical protein
MVIDKNQNILHWSFFNVLFRDNKHVEQFQVLFDDRKITIYLQLDTGDLSKELYAYYLGVIKRNLEFDEYALEINAPFILSKNAKHRYVINTSTLR